MVRWTEADVRQYNTKETARLTPSTQKAVDAANKKSVKVRRASAFKHRVQIGRSTIMLTNEGLEQYTVAQWLRWKGYPGQFLHVPNERKCSVQEMIMLKALGLEPGAADFLIFVTPPNFAFKGFAIEMKAEGGTMTTNQAEWAHTMRGIGWRVETCYGADTAIKLLQEAGY